MFYLIAFLVFFLSGCAATSPVGQLQDLLAKAFGEASFNLHHAVDLGKLSATDPLIPCVDQAAGVFTDVATTNSQGYETSTILGKGAILYIQGQGGLASQQGAIGSGACDAIIGKFTRDAMKSQIPGGLNLSR